MIILSLDKPERIARYQGTKEKMFNTTSADKYPRFVIPAQAGIPQSTGCRIKSGMTVLAI